MRVVCRECGNPGVVRSSKKITLDYSVLYCQCKDPECGHTWKADLSYSSTISPSAKTASQLALNLIKTLRPEDRQLVLDEMGGR